MEMRHDNTRLPIYGKGDVPAFIAKRRRLPPPPWVMRISLYLHNRRRARLTRVSLLSQKRVMRARLVFALHRSRYVPW
jgi:hypothetical protein